MKDLLVNFHLFCYTLPQSSTPSPTLLYHLRWQNFLHNCFVRSYPFIKFIFKTFCVPILPKHIFFIATAPGPNVIKFFIFYALQVFVISQSIWPWHVLPALFDVCKQGLKAPTRGKLLSGAPIFGRLLALLTNIRLGWRGLPAYGRPPSGQLTRLDVGVLILFVSDKVCQRLANVLTFFARVPLPGIDVTLKIIKLTKFILVNLSFCEVLVILKGASMCWNTSLSQQNSTYQSPMQANKCLKLPQMSN